MIPTLEFEVTEAGKVTSQLEDVAIQGVVARVKLPSGVSLLVLPDDNLHAVYSALNDPAFADDLRSGLEDLKAGRTQQSGE
jgi:hypothetical protein